MPTRRTPRNNGGLSLLGLVSHYLGGGRAWLPEHPHISLCLAIGSEGVRGLTQLSGSVSQSPWEPEGLSEEGRKCAQGWGWEEEFQQCTPPAARWGTLPPLACFSCLPSLPQAWGCLAVPGGLMPGLSVLGLCLWPEMVFRLVSKRNRFFSLCGEVDVLDWG